MTHRHDPSVQPSDGAHVCTFVPPYVLEALTLHGGPEAQRARRTLAHDQQLRATREALSRGGEGNPGLRGTATPTPTPTPVPSATPTPRRRIHDAQNLQALPGVVVREEGAAATSDVAVTEAYDGLGATFALFQEAFDRTSLDDENMAMLATVHYSRDYDNAFWNGQQMVFGDGDGTIFGRFTASLDVIGHELAHGVTEFTAGLRYQGQPGALNESMSDVFGVLVKQKALGQTAEQADWLIGAELLAPGVKGVALRSMKAPGTAYDDPRLGQDPQPDHMDRFVNTYDDNGGVHINSGIPNKAFYLVATTLGGYAWEAPGRIWYQTLTTKVRPTCDFATFAQLTLDTATELYGASSREVTAVRDAWAGVGVVPGVRVKPGTAAPAVATDDDEDRMMGEVPEIQGQLVVRQTGGVTGVAKERVVSVADLPPGDVEHWQTLLSAPARLSALAEHTPTVPDARTYHIQYTSQEGQDVDVRIPEPALPHAEQALVQRTLLG